MLQADDFKRLAKQESNARLARRYLALYQFMLGHNRTDIAINLGVARGSVNTWVSAYLNEGLAGLKDKPHPGRECQLSSEQLTQLKQFIESNAVKLNGGRLIAEDVRQYIADEFCIHYKPANIYRLMHHLGLSWITSRSKHPKQSQACQDAFKKLPHGNDPSHPRTFTTRSH